METNTITIEFTQEELQALKFWLSVIQFQGTREQVKKPLEMYDAVVAKLEGMQVAEHPHRAIRMKRDIMEE